MRIGLYIKWNKGSLNSTKENVIGDELYGESMCKALSKMTGIDDAQLYAPNYLPKHKLDLMIYMNDTMPRQEWADKHIVYMQNGYGNGSLDKLKEFYQYGYDGYMFISNKLLKIHNDLGHTGIFLPFGVDTEQFYPREKKNELSYEVAYIGNDIKGVERTNKYIYPAVKYNFGLYGNWQLLYSKYKFWKNPNYQKKFVKIAKGKIPQEDVPVLYSSTAINLNCTLQDCVDWDVITLRTYEVLACRGFLISDKTPIAEKQLKSCLVFTDGAEDLDEKIQYYLAHPEERLQIAQRGYDYVIKFATIEARMAELYQYIKEI